MPSTSTPRDMKLSTNFTFHELVASQTAAWKNIEQFFPPNDLIDKLI